jgi:uncharacterized membrane protein YfcA
VCLGGEVIVTGAVLLVVGISAGVVSTVVSLASIVSYPALLALGLPPLSANVTNTVALAFTAVGATAGSQQELTGQRDRVLRLGLLTALGGATGAALLLLTPARSFQFVAPVLVAGASLVLLVQPRLADAARREARHGRLLQAAVFAVSIYTGYFGAAGGILMLAVLAALIELPLVRVNAVKNAVSGLANGVAAVGFAVFGPVRWSAVLPLAVGFFVGGWIGPSLVRRLPGQMLRVAVALCGLGVAVKLGLDSYR